MAGFLPAYDIGSPLLNLAPLNQAIQFGAQQRQQGFENERALTKEDMAKKQFAIQEQERKAKEFGHMALAAHQDPDPARGKAIFDRMVASDPEFATDAQKHGLDLNDWQTASKMIAAKAGLLPDPQAKEKERANINLLNAHAAYYQGRASLDQKERWKLDPTRNIMVNSITGETRPISGVSAVAQDPLDGAGLDDNGEIIAGRPRTSEPSPYLEPTGETWQLPQQGQTPQRMNLGGPMDDIDRSMRLDEGQPQAPAGVRMAQAAPAPWRPEPSATDQAAARMFGPTGRTSPEVPGVVTDAGRNRRMDVQATREAQGQRAVDGATPEQQDRLKRFREDQERWAWVYKRQPRAGYYYGPDGRELALSDKNYKGDKETQAQVLMNMQKIDQATKKLLEPSFAGAITPGGVGDYVTRSIAGQANVGETGQAFADLKQAALGIAYALSGKQVAVAEMKNFIDSYGPQPWDSEWRIKAKAERMKEFYGALLSATRGGQDYDKAFATAMAKMGVKNPDGTPAGQPAAASAGQPPPPDLSKVPTEELLRRLPGAR